MSLPEEFPPAPSVVPEPEKADPDLTPSLSRRNLLLGVQLYILNLIGCNRNNDSKAGSIPSLPDTTPITSSRKPREFRELPAGTVTRVSFQGGASYGTSIHIGAGLKLDTDNLPTDAGVLGQLSWVDLGAQKIATVFLTHDDPTQFFPLFTTDPGTPQLLQIRSLAKGEPVISDSIPVYPPYHSEIFGSYGGKPVLSQHFTPKANPSRPWNTPAPGTDIRFQLFGAVQDGNGVISKLQMNLDTRGALQKTDNPLVIAILRWTDPKGNPGEMKLAVGADFGLVLAPFHPDAKECTLQLVNGVSGQELFPASPFSPLQISAFGITY